MITSTKEEQILDLNARIDKYIASELEFNKVNVNRVDALKHLKEVSEEAREMAFIDDMEYYIELHSFRLRLINEFLKEI